MRVVRSIDEFREARAAAAGAVCLVPTMGALHPGHLSLVRIAHDHAPCVAVSIFVNPTQFDRPDDLQKYPRTLDEDLAALEQAGTELVFVPEAGEIYPPQAFTMSLDMPTLTDVLEGKHRPGHFRGVCQIVAKLFNIVRPDAAVFGMKDFQQLRVIEEMTRALDFPVRIIRAPTMRDPDGLAMSSRNRRLTDDQRARALSIPRGLFAAQTLFQQGVRQTNRLIATVQNALLEVGSLGHVPLSIDYVACVCPHTLRPIREVEASALLAVAARVGEVRLIDNLLLEP